MACKKGKCTIKNRSANEEWAKKNMSKGSTKNASKRTK